MPQIKTESVQFDANGGRAPGYLARPDDNVSHPGVVVIQEWWGLEPHIKDVAARFAREGFVALAPDLYRGVVVSEPDEARKLAMGLDREQAARDIQGALSYLKGLASVVPKRMGVVGFCMGGSLALFTACRSPDVGAAAVFYGGMMPADEDLARLSAPVLGLYGEEDAGIPLASVEKLRETLQRAGKTHKIHVYPGAGHAFFNDTRPSHRPEAARDAWERTLAWFQRYLVP